MKRLSKIVLNLFFAISVLTVFSNVASAAMSPWTQVEEMSFNLMYIHEQYLALHTCKLVQLLRLLLVSLMQVITGRKPDFIQVQVH